MKLMHNNKNTELEFQQWGLYCTRVLPLFNLDKNKAIAGAYVSPRHILLFFKEETSVANYMASMQNSVTLFKFM